MKYWRYNSLTYRVCVARNRIENRVGIVCIYDSSNSVRQSHYVMGSSLHPGWIVRLLKRGNLSTRAKENWCAENVGIKKKVGCYYRGWKIISQIYSSLTAKLAITCLETWYKYMPWTLRRTSTTFSSCYQRKLRGNVRAVFVGLCGCDGCEKSTWPWGCSEYFGIFIFPSTTRSSDHHNLSNACIANRLTTYFCWTWELDISLMKYCSAIPLRYFFFFTWIHIEFLFLFSFSKSRLSSNLWPIIFSSILPKK